jgi:hypothetical protein
MGIEPMTTVLPRLCATAAPRGQNYIAATYLFTIPTKGLKNEDMYWVGSGGFEPPKLSQLIYSQSHLATLVTAQDITSSF